MLADARRRGGRRAHHGAAYADSTWWARRGGARLPSLRSESISVMVGMLVVDDFADLFRAIVLQRRLARQVDDGADPTERDSVPYCRVGTTRSGRSNAPVMISILAPPIRRKLNGVPQP